MFGVFASGWFVLNRTAWGRMIYAVGGNEERAGYQASTRVV
jgi:ribose/xylose/arabinose/galactoside ABC-type transport system permease subunit